MQVSVETTQGLERRLTVSVPAKRIDDEVAKRMQKLARTAKLDGFRPGKVPQRLIKERFSGAVYEEVVRELMGDTLNEALQQEKLNPVAVPNITPLDLEPGKDLKYLADFEVFPDFEAQDMSGVTVEKPSASLEEIDIDKVVEQLRTQARRWQPAERPAQDGDMLEISFEGSVNGEPLQGGSAENFSVVIGAHKLIPGFEEGLIGASIGSEVTLDLKFPEDYHAKDIAGQAVQFKVKVTQIMEGFFPEIDDEFASSLGIKEGGVAAMREQIKETLQQGLDQIIASKLKDQVFTEWLKRNVLELPKSLITQEVTRLKKQGQGQDAEHQHVHDENCDHDHDHNQAHTADEQVDEALLAKAQHNIALGLLFHQAVAKYELSVEPQQVRKEIERIAAPYQDPREVIAWYYGDKKRLAEIETLVLENQLLEKLIENANIVEKPTSYQELVGTGLEETV